MNTPITDRYYQSRVGGTGEELPFQLARRLEQDRATYRQALIDIYLSPTADSWAIANQALQAASTFDGEDHTLPAARP